MLYFNYFAIELKKRNNLNINGDMKTFLRALALGDEKPFKNQLNEVIKTLSNRDHYGFKEKHFQVITLRMVWSFWRFREPYFKLSSRATLCSVLGWVLNRFFIEKSFPVKGLMMNICAVCGSASGMTIPLA